jgi:hypothetical protein
MLIPKNYMHCSNTAELIVKYQSINTLKQFEIIADLNIEIKQKLNLTDTTKSIMC